MLLVQIEPHLGNDAGDLQAFSKNTRTHDVLRWRTSFVKHIQFLGSQGLPCLTLPSALMLHEGLLPGGHPSLYKTRSLDEVSLYLTIFGSCTSLETYCQVLQCQATVRKYLTLLMQERTR